MFDLEPVGFESGSNEFAEVGFLEFVFFAAGFDAREIQNVVDEGAEALALFANDAEIFLVFFPGGKAAEFERFGIEADERQRRAQLVGNVGDEVGLESREIHFARHVAVCHVHTARHQ